MQHIEQNALFCLCYFLLSFFVGEAAFFFTCGTPHYTGLKIRCYRCIYCYCSCVWDCFTPYQSRNPWQPIVHLSSNSCMHSILHFFFINAIWNEENFYFEAVLCSHSCNLPLNIVCYFFFCLFVLVWTFKIIVKQKRFRENNIQLYP